LWRGIVATHQLTSLLKIEETSSSSGSRAIQPSGFWDSWFLGWKDSPNSIPKGELDEIRFALNSNLGPLFTPFSQPSPQDFISASR
jgi:hypothetical protein